ncbi:MAG: KEOPS complex subunit Cgi121 [Candidatus Thorarchaeota archaeon]
MQIERLFSPKGVLYVGIAEIRNERKLGKELLISIAIDTSDKVQAVQLLNPSLIVDSHHLVCAAQNAVNAWYGNYAQARALDIEIAVFASGQKQIGRALDTFGVRDNLDTIAVVIIDANEENAKGCFSVLQQQIGSISDTQFPPDTMRFKEIMIQFGIEDSEIQALSENDDPMTIQGALSRCVVSRVSSVALES